MAGFRGWKNVVSGEEKSTNEGKDRDKKLTD